MTNAEIAYNADCKRNPTYHDGTVRPKFEFLMEPAKKTWDCNNTLAAMYLLGWQGGTIHQVSQETGLTVSEILDSENIYADIMAKRKP